MAGSGSTPEFRFRMVPLFDHLVGAGEEGLRHGEAERLGGVQADDQLELARLLHGQLGWRGAP